MPQHNRQLAAILFTDIVGYTAIMQMDETHASEIMDRYSNVLQNTINDFSGKILNDYGDGSLCSFTSATQAVQCAMKLQKQFQTIPSVPLRIGLHIGEIFFQEEKVMGDGVNVAARVQSLGQANSILFSKEVFDKIKNQSEFKTVCLGMFEFKSVEEPMEIYALANDGLKVPKREEMSGKLKEIEIKSSRKKWLTLAAILVLVIAGFLFYKIILHPPGFTGSEKSIAVLPFENIGSDTSEDYISDGITQDIIGNLSKITSLQKVIGWISVRSFKKTVKPIKDIAAELDVAAILSGTIEKEDQKTRIRAELTEVGTNKLLWVDDFEYTGNDFLSIQAKVALHIAKTLIANLTPEEKKGLAKNYTENAEAYKFYRKGRNFWDHQRTKESYDSAELYFNKALALDSDYALAYSGIADCYTYNQKGLSQLDAIPIAEKFARKALSFDSTLTEAKTTLAFIESIFYYHWKESLALFKNIVSENSNYPTAYLYYSNVLLWSGHYEECMIELKKAIQLDPLNPVLNYVWARNYAYRGKTDSALILTQETINMSPLFRPNYLNLAYIFTKKQQYQKAIDIYAKLPQKPFDQGNNGLLQIANCYALSGNKIKANEYLEKVSLADQQKCTFLMASVYVSLGDNSKALSQLEYGYEERILAMVGLKISTNLDPLRNEPRFKELMKKINLD